MGKIFHPRVISLSFGDTKNYSVTEDGQCYIWWEGRDYDGNYFTPKLIPGLHGIIKIVGGAYSVNGFISDDYSIYLLDYDYSDFSHRQTYLNPPTMLPIKARDFDVGWEMTGIIGTDLKIYLCLHKSTSIKMENLPTESVKLKKIEWRDGNGMNLYQVIFPNLERVKETDLKFKQVAIGHSEIVALSSEGDIYRMKYDHKMITEQKSSYSFPLFRIVPDYRTITSLNSIRNVKFPTDLKFTQISANSGNYSALTNDGKVYVWGKGLTRIFDLTEIDGPPTENITTKSIPNPPIKRETSQYGDFDADEMNMFCPNQKFNSIIFDHPTRIKSISNLPIKAISINSTYLAILTEQEELIIKGETAWLIHHSADYDDYERSLFDESCLSD